MPTPVSGTLCSGLRGAYSPSLSCPSHVCHTYLGLAILIAVAVTLLVTFQTPVVIGDMPSLADAGTI